MIYIKLNCVVLCIYIVNILYLDTSQHIFSINILYINNIIVNKSDIIRFAKTAQKEQKYILFQLFTKLQLAGS